jgi:type VI secretion system secreted protein VgrG
MTTLDELKPGIPTMPLIDALNSGISPALPSVDSLRSGASSALSSAKDTAGALAASAAGTASTLAGNASNLADKALGAASGFASNALGKAGSKLGVPLGELLSLDATPFVQNGRLLKLQLFEDGQLTDRLPAQRAEGEEALSSTYKIVVTCQSPESGIELKHLIGLPAQIGILTANAGGLDSSEQEEVIRCGIVTAARALGADGGFARYQLTIEPPIALLRHVRKSRVFQDISVPDIVKTILDEHLAANPAFAKNFAHRFDLSETYPAHSYCLQYRESDLDFIERLLAEEGIAYRFEHTGGKTDARADDENAEEEGEEAETPRVTFVAFDDPWRLPQAAQGEIRFHREGATEAADSLTAWTSQRQIGPGAVSLVSFDYKLAATGAGGRSTETDQGEAGGIEAGLEDYDPQTLYYASAEEGLDRYTRLRQQAHDRNKKTFHGAGNVREIQAGEWFRLTGHPDYELELAEDAEFTITRLHFIATNNLPGLNSGGMDCHGPSGLAMTGIGSMTGTPPNTVIASEARQSMGGTDRHDTSSRAPTASAVPERPYTVKIEAQRKGLPLVPTFAHGKHAKPTASGSQTAIVVGPADEEVYTDELGRIKVQFHWQRPREHKETGAAFDEHSSCWIRVAYPSAGAGWGHQFIPRIGQEVVVDFLEDDIDRPLVTGVVYDGRQAPPWFSGAGELPANKTLSGIKTKEHHGSQYGELLLDDTPGEVRTKLSSEHGKTQLNQGFLTHPRTDGQGEPRGEGFELRTDRHGAIRAGEGLLLSTEAKLAAQGKQLHRETAQSQLDAARQLARNHSDTAANQKADPTETGPKELDEEGQAQQDTMIGHLDHLTETVHAWELDTNTDLEGPPNNSGQPGRQAVLLASAQGGLGVTTPKELVLVAEKNLDTISQRDTQQTTNRRWLHNAGRKISLFVHGVADKMNLKLITAKGHANMWAQSGDVEIVGDQNVRLHANQGKLEIFAGEEVFFNCGGAYIRLRDGNVDIHAPSEISFKASHYVFIGPASETMKAKSPEPKLCGGDADGAEKQGGGGVLIGGNP